MSRERIAWAARLPEVVAERGPATVAVAAGWVLGREPSRAELVAAHRAARRLVAAGHLAGGRTWAPDATGREVLTPCIAAPGTNLPAGKSHGAIAADAGVSRSTVARTLRRQAAEVAAASNAQSALPAYGQPAPEVAAVHFRQSAALHHRQHLRPRFVAAVVRGFLRLRPAERAAAAESINAALAASMTERTET